MKALVVDDSRVMRSILRRFLAPLGFEVVEAAHGGEALERLAEDASFALALVDWHMPVMNGLELVRAARGDARHAAMKIMMVTTEAEVEFMREALDAGADEYLMKPFTDEALREKVAILGLAA